MAVVVQFSPCVQRNEQLQASLIYMPSNGKPSSNNSLGFKMQEELGIAANFKTESKYVRVNASTEDEKTSVNSHIEYKETLFRVNVEFTLDRDRTKDVIFRYCNPGKKYIFGQSWLQLDKNVFKDKIEPSHKTVNVTPFSFGSLAGMNTFVEHYGSHWSAGDKKSTIGKVKADFLHDMKTFYLYFTVNNKRAIPRKKGIIVGTEYKLEILYTAIQRILVQKKAEKKPSGQDLLVYEVFLQLAGAPFIRKNLTARTCDSDNSDEEINEGIPVTWIRVVDFGVPETTTHCSKEVIGLSRILKLKLVDQGNSADWIQALDVIGQLASCCKFSTVYFTSMTTVECRNEFNSLSIPKAYFGSLYGLKCVLTCGYDVTDQLYVTGRLNDVNKKIKQYAEEDDSALSKAFFDISRMLNQAEVFCFEDALDYLFHKFRCKDNSADSEPKMKENSNVDAAPLHCKDSNGSVPNGNGARKKNKKKVLSANNVKSEDLLPVSVSTLTKYKHESKALISVDSLHDRKVTFKGDAQQSSSEVCNGAVPNGNRNKTKGKNRIREFGSSATAVNGKTTKRINDKCKNTDENKLTNSDDFDFRKAHFPSNVVILRRIVLTPTRIIFLPPLPQMMNYLLRTCNPANFIRVTLKEDDFSNLLCKHGGLSVEFLWQCFGANLQDGIKIGDRCYEFFGSSTSQLREHGILLYAKDQTGRTADDIRNSLGELKAIPSVPKYLARMGQSLSQSLASVDVDRKYCFRQCDIERNRYNFTDGVGRISSDLMKECYKKLSLREGMEPSAIQIRYGGCKGMLVLDNTLEGKQVIFRDSQWKYDSNATSLEILKFSEPRHVYLNRPFITILDQMGVPRSVFVSLQTTMIKGLIDSLLKSQAATRLLQEKALLRMPYNRLHAAGFDLSLEPFFRPMTMALYRSSIETLKHKARIEIPYSEGRTMFGVVDETATLEYGQIFVQFTKHSGDEQAKLETEILEGEILVTKNPCMHPGDVRKLHAIDVKALHHIKDCIVFPSKGHRPHPDEMAGSDLDGDEYCVIWHKPLYFERENHEPMNYRNENPSTIQERFAENDDVLTKVEKMGRFLCRYIQNDCVGLIASAHLAWADRETIFSNRCMNIAKKFSVSLDFVKTGKSTTLASNEMVVKYPDFMEKMSEKKTYLSHRALGVLYRNCRRIDMASKVLGDEVKVELDEDLVMNDLTKKEVRKAKMAFEEYKNLMEEPAKMFCITNEGELLSGAISSNDKLLNGKNSHENLEMSLGCYIPNVFKTMKNRFYKKFGENPKVEKLCLYYMQGEKPVMTEKNVSLALSLFINRLSRGMDKKAIEEFELEDVMNEVYRKASAWYQVAYRAKSEGSSIFLGLPWVVHDVLILMKQKHKGKPKQPAFVKQIDAMIKTEREKIFSFLSLKEIDNDKRIVKAFLDRWLIHHRRSVSLRSGTTSEEICHELEVVFCIISSQETLTPAELLVKVLVTLAQFTFTTDRNEIVESIHVSSNHVRKELGLLAVMALANLTSTGSLWGKCETPDENNIFGCSFLDDKYREEIYLPLRANSEFCKCICRYENDVTDYLERLSGVDQVRCEFIKKGEKDDCTLSIIGKRLNIEYLKDCIVAEDFERNVCQSVREDI